jgi:hypothetical protein
MICGKGERARRQRREAGRRKDEAGSQSRKDKPL